MSKDSFNARKSHINARPQAGARQASCRRRTSIEALEPLPAKGQRRFGLAPVTARDGHDRRASLRARHIRAADSK